MNLNEHPFMVESRSQAAARKCGISAAMSSVAREQPAVYREFREAQDDCVALRRAKQEVGFLEKARAMGARVCVSHATKKYLARHTVPAAAETAEPSSDRAAPPPRVPPEIKRAPVYDGHDDAADPAYSAFERLARAALGLAGPATTALSIGTTSISPDRVRAFISGFLSRRGLAIVPKN